MEVALWSEEKFLFQIKGFEYKHKYSTESKCSQQTNKLHVPIKNYFCTMNKYWWEHSI